MQGTIALMGIVGALAVSSTAVPSFAEVLNFKAEMTGAAELPPVATKAAGGAQISYDTATRKVSWTVVYSGLSGAATAAHLHGPAESDRNGPPVIVFSPSVLSPITGSTTLTDVQARDLLGGKWYVNVHTVAHPGGEIRGQVAQIR